MIHSGCKRVSTVPNGFYRPPKRPSLNRGSTTPLYRQTPIVNISDESLSNTESDNSVSQPKSSYIIKSNGNKKNSTMKRELKLLQTSDFQGGRIKVKNDRV